MVADAWLLVVQSMVSSMVQDSLMVDDDQRCLIDG